MTKAKVNLAGYGQQGYCKLCSIADPVLQDEFDKRVGAKQGGKYVYSPQALNEWLEQKGSGLSASRPTMYEHRKHVMHPKDRLVSAVEKRQMATPVPATVTNEQFLDTLIAIGHRKAAENPDEVTIDQALKATQIKQNSKDRGSAQAVLVNVFTSGPSGPTIVEGEVKTL